MNMDQGMGGGGLRMPTLPNVGSQNVASRIAEKIGSKKSSPSPEGQSINMLISAIKALNLYADAIAENDAGNSKAIRVVIRILGEILKSGQHGAIPEAIKDNIMGSEGSPNSPGMMGMGMPGA